MKKQKVLFVCWLCVMAASIAQATTVDQDITWEGYVNITDGDRIEYRTTNDFFWTLNEDALGNPADVTYGGAIALCLVGYNTSNTVQSTLTIQTTVGAPGVLNYIGRSGDSPIGIRLGAIDDSGTVNIESGVTLLIHNLYAHGDCPTANAVVNINDGQVFCYGDVQYRNMSNTTTNISPNGSLRIIADIANVYDQATYTAHTVGDGCPGGQVFPEPGCLLIFADGGDYNSSPTVLITAQVGAPYIVTQPVDAFVNVGETAVFTVEAINSVTGDATGLHYNWYEYVDGVSDIPVGTDSATLSLPGVDLSYDGKQYYCDVFNASYTVTSDLAYLTVRRKVAHWQFEDDMIDIVDGWTGEYIDPNVSNPTPTPVYNAAGIDGKAFEFSVDPPTLIRVINSNDGSFDFYPHGLTASCWVKSTQPQTEIYTYPLLYGNPHESSGDEITRGWCIQNKTDSETVGGHVFDVGATIYSSALTNDEWHMVTLTHAGGTIAFYADGQLMGSYTDTTPTFTLMDSLVLMGALPNGVRSFNGLLDDVRIYNYPLNAYEVATLYTDFVPGATICAEPVVNDINGDCIVNLLDFAEIAAAWLECNEVPTCLTVNPQ